MTRKDKKRAPRLRRVCPEDTRERIKLLVQNGNDVYVAGQFARASRAQVDRWLEIDPKFRDAVASARATLELEQTSILSTAARDGNVGAIRQLDDRRQVRESVDELERLRELTR